DRARNLVRSGETLIWGHRYDVAAETLEEAVSLARAHGIRDVEGFALAQQAFQGVVTTGDVPRFAPLLEEALRAATEAASEEVLTTAQVYLFETLEWRGYYGDVLPLCEAVSAAGRRLRRPDFVIWADWFHAKASCCLGDYGPAITRLRETQDLC